VAVDLQYATIIDPHTLGEIDRVSTAARAVVAMKVGATRLIDNIALLSPKTDQED
jgi:pantothenate synthetase